MLREDLIRTIFNKTNTTYNDINFIKKHRIENYIHCYGKEVPAEIRDQLNTEVDKLVALHNERIAFLKQYYNETGKKPLIIKGFTAFYHTGDMGLIRRSNDLDMFVDHAESFIENLLSNGFEEIKSPNDHEYSTLIKDSIEIDLHKYFIVRAYPIEMASKTSDKGEIVTANEMRYVKTIPYTDILSHSTELPYFFIPNITFSILLSCINIFNDYITGFAKTPCIKLMEIIELLEMLESCSLNESEFDDLIKYYQAEDAVSFMNYLVTQLTGNSVFEKFDYREYSEFPQLLFWHFNTWVTPNTTAIFSVESLKNITLNMPRNIIDIAKPTVCSNYGNFTLKGIEKNTEGKSPRIDISVGNENGLSIQVKVYTTLPIEGDMFHINTGKIRRNLFGSKIDYMNRELYDYFSDDISYTVTLKFTPEESIDISSQSTTMILFIEQKTDTFVSSNYYIFQLENSSSDYITEVNASKAN